MSPVDRKKIERVARWIRAKVRERAGLSIAWNTASEDLKNWYRDRARKALLDTGEIAAALILCAMLATCGQHPAFAQEHVHKDGTVITGETARFYETWMQPDHPTVSCCNQLDCYPTPARRNRLGHIVALHRESHEWIAIPPEKVEINRDSPDGMSHLCASSFKQVFCFVFGGGT